LVCIFGIYKECELDESPTTDESAAVQVEGSREVQCTVRPYSLDVIISEGHRLMSSRKQVATQRDNITKVIVNLINRDNP
jgi:hypothetical protein